MECVTSGLFRSPVELLAKSFCSFICMHGTLKVDKLIFIKFDAGEVY